LREANNTVSSTGVSGQRLDRREIGMQTEGDGSTGKKRTHQMSRADIKRVLVADFNEKKWGKRCLDIDKKRQPHGKEDAGVMKRE